MANYKRLVSYMYNYDNGIKRNNVGYSRVEARNGQCKATINITVAGINEEELEVYFFKRNGYSMEGILLGKLLVRKGVGQFRALTDSENIMNSTYSLDDIGGLVLYHSDKKYYATEWDDIPVTKEMVNGSLIRKASMIAEEDQKEDQKEDNNVDLKEEIEDIKEARREDIEEVFKEDVIEEKGKEYKTIKLDNNENLAEETKIVEENVEEDLEIEKQLREIKEAGKTEANIKKKTRNWSRFEEHPEALKINNSFPKMYPFEDNEVAWCVRIEPQDIGILPMEYWYYGNNSFLLHGFYCYSHLIFARINDKAGIQYIIGVPGIYHNREKFMAQMFGFAYFKSIKRKELRTGEFGYWYTPVCF